MAAPPCADTGSGRAAAASMGKSSNELGEFPATDVSVAEDIQYHVCPTYFWCFGDGLLLFYPHYINIHTCVISFAIIYVITCEAMRSPAQQRFGGQLICMCGCKERT